MTEFRLFNTMTRSVEPFAPADGETVRIYSCGPTVYNPAHLGNFRTFLFADLLRRTLRLRGWKVRQVMNLTDVDDKIIRRAHEQGKTIREVTEPITAIFHADREYLRIEPAEVYPKATDYIPQMIALVERLIERRRRVPGRRQLGLFRDRSLSRRTASCRASTRARSKRARASRRTTTRRRTRRTSRSGRRRSRRTRRRARRGIRPGAAGVPAGISSARRWRSICLGETLDIHCGGIDLIFPHHEDEIAQSEAATGQTFSRFWCHGAFLLTEGTKMAKRLGQRDDRAGDARERDISAAAVRHFVFNTHYRKELNLSEEALEASINAVRRVGDFAERLATATGGTPELGGGGDAGGRGGRGGAVRRPERAERAGGLFTFITRANAELDRKGEDAEALGAGACGVRENQRGAGHRSGPRRWTIRSSRRGWRSGCRRVARRASGGILPRRTGFAAS